jgi:hypothetical protein
LLQLSKTKYVYISYTLESFQSKDQIKTFSSPLDEDYVPSAYAIGNKYLYYLPSSSKTILNDTIKNDKNIVSNIAKYQSQMKTTPFNIKKIKFCLI